MKNFYNWLRSSLEFNQREANGFIVLMALLLLFLSAPFFVNIFFDQPYDNILADKKMADSIETLIRQEEAKDTLINKQKFKSERGKIAGPSFSFDPNHISRDSLQLTGLPKKVINNIVAYREKGGRFYIKKDLMKIYGLHPSAFHAIENYLTLPDTLPGKNDKRYSTGNSKNQINQNTQTSQTKFKEKTFTIIDINTADSLQLETLPMIGKVLSVRIVKYREKLGGFIDVAQLKEVYGIDSATYEILLPKIKITGTNNIRKVNINQATKAELAAHPYFRKAAGIIINYRNQHGNFSKIEDLKQIRLLDEAQIKKMEPYIGF